MCSMTSSSSTFYLMCSMTTSSSTSSFPSLMSPMSCKLKKPRKVRQKKIGCGSCPPGKCFFWGWEMSEFWGGKCPSFGGGKCPPGKWLTIQIKCALRQQTAWILKSASVISEVCHLYLSFKTALPQKIFIFNLDYDSVFLKLQNLTIHTRDIDRLLNSFQASSCIS